MTFDTAARTLGARVLQALESSPGDVVMICEGSTVTRGEFAMRIRLRAAWLRHLGVGEGTVAFVSTGRGMDYWVDLVALWAVGAIAAPLDRGVTGPALQALANLVMPAAVLGMNAWPLEDTRAPRCVPSGTEHGVQVLVRDLFERSDAPAAILLTSGSTGAPKAATLTHRALLGNALATLPVLPMAPGTRLAIAIPFHFTSAICHFLAAVLGGATLICTERRLLQRELCEYLLAHEASAFGGAPLQLRWIAELGESVPLPLEWLMSSGDHLAPSVVAALARALPRTAVVTVYGLTEVGGRLCVLDPAFARAHAGAVGRAIHGMHVTVRDEQGREVAAGTVGEVYANGEYLANGYLSNEEETARRFTELGFRTGDVGEIGTDGLLYIRGRNDDMFKVAGQKVSAAAITEALLSLGCFSDVAVLALDDELLGKLPYAYVVYRDGAPPLADGVILRRLRAILPANHLPRRIIHLTSIPRTGSGKLQRGALAVLAGTDADSPRG